MEVVVAHELGHRREGHVAKLTLLAMTGAAVAVLVLWAVLGTRVADPRTLPEALLLLLALELAALAPGAWLSRRFERAADRWSLELTEKPAAFARATSSWRGATSRISSRPRRLPPPVQPSDAAGAARARPARGRRPPGHRVQVRGDRGARPTGKRAIVTGASSGIGRATAAALAAAGVRVAGGARRVERLETEIALELDVTDAASCERFVAEAVERLGGLDILVNNAGLALGRAPFDESSEEDEATVLGVNVAGLDPDDPALPAALRRLGPHRQHGLGRGPPGVRGRRARTSRRSSPSAASPTRCARICSAGRSASRRSIPGLVETEFSLVRFKGDEEKAAAVYRGVEALRPEDIAECILFALTRPWHVNVDEIVVKARNQSSGGRILRDE